MNAPPPDPAAQRKAATLVTMLGVALVFGVLNVALHPDAMQANAITGTQVVANVVLLLLGFRWLQIDSAQLDIRRPWWLNVGVVLLAIVFVPYYFYKTRPEGRRLRPILGFFGVVLAVGVVSAIGSMLMMAMRSPALATPGL